MNIKAITDQANGQWDNIIVSLTNVSLTRNKHTACPLCGGKDRFRFDNLEGRGTYICNQCGAGDGLSLLSKIQGRSLVETASCVASFLGVNTSPIKVADKFHPIDCLDNAVLATSDYFIRKGLSCPVLMTKNIALLPLINIQGKITAIQSIQIDGTKRFRKGDQKKGSFYVIVTSEQKADHLNFSHMQPKTTNKQNRASQSCQKLTFIISEGVATAMTTKLFMPEAVCIAAIDAGNLLPVATTIREHYPDAKIIIAGDNDVSHTPNVGQEKAIRAAQMVNGRVTIPNTDDKADWNDVYLEVGLELAKKQFINGIHVESTAVNTLADGTLLTEDEVERLSLMNQSCTQVVLSDCSLVYSKKYDQVAKAFILKPERIHVFKSKFNHQPRIAKKNAGHAWDLWANKNYKPDGIGFYPNPDKCPDTILNLFDGFTLVSKKGDCSLYLNHIRHVLCSGDQAAYECFISWLAHLFQKPDQKPSFAIVMSSEQGAGKGISIQPLLQILGAYGVYENGIERIVGRFNSTVANKLLVFVDEVYVDRNRDADVLKSLISETTVNLEQKGIDPIQIPSYARFIFASNRIDAIKAGIRERRYLVLEINNQYAQDKAYFDQLGTWIENDGAAYLLDYLLHYDITNFDHRRAIHTSILKSMIANNLTGIEGFIYERLLSDNPFNILGNMGRVEVSELANHYLEWAKEQGLIISKPRASKEIGDMFRKVFQVETTGYRGRNLAYILPDMDILRERFAHNKMKMKTEDLFY